MKGFASLANPMRSFGWPWQYDASRQLRGLRTNLAMLLVYLSSIARLLPAVAACNLMKAPPAERERSTGLISLSA